ncbi:hypothetical protein J3D46_004936 [Paenarthrobacter sp. A20]|nr:hypothetical protein [Paenarthrobacter sp. A20]
MLFNGERVGSGTGHAADIAIDPITGTSLTSAGRPNALSMIAVSDRGSMFDPTAVFYWTKSSQDRHAPESWTSTSQSARTYAHSHRRGSRNHSGYPVRFPLWRPTLTNGCGPAYRPKLPDKAHRCTFHSPAFPHPE